MSFRQSVVTEKNIQRLGFIKKQCSDLSSTRYWSELRPSGNIWAYRGLSYCITPKVGCTFWKRAFRFLAKDYKETNEPVRKPSNIDRHQVHYYKVHNITSASMDSNLGRILLSTGNSFMFSRDPYTRVWSAYIDKFLMPDFWMTQAVSAAKVTRKANEGQDLKCANNITFEEFLRFLVQTPLGEMNEHWQPIHRICSPCHTNFDVIGQQETFAADTNYIIYRYGIDNIRDTNDKASRVREEIEMLVDYNFALTKIRDKNCFKVLDIANRVWLAFQFNGYIHKGVKFPLKSIIRDGLFSNATEVFKQAVFHVIDTQTNQEMKDLKEQKQNMMAEAYRRIPSKIMDQFKTIFHYDFLLFQYDREARFLN